MGMTAADLRSTGTGDWLAQLKTILQVAPDEKGQNPKAKHRKTKDAVNELLTNLLEGATNNPDDDKTGQTEKEKIVFNAVDQLIRDKVARTKRKKTPLKALAKFEDVLKQEIAAKFPGDDILQYKWKAMMTQSVKALRTEELNKVLVNDGEDAFDRELDTLVLSKGQTAFDEVLGDDENGSPKLHERCARKMLASDEGKQTLEASPHLSMNAIKVLQDPKLAADLLSSCHLTALGGDDFSTYIENLGDEKDDVLAEVLLAHTKKPVPTNPKDAEYVVAGRAKFISTMAEEMDPAIFAKLAKTMLQSQEHKQILAANPKLSAALLTSVDPTVLKDIDFDATFGAAKNDILAESIVTLSMKKSSTGNGGGKPPATLDPKLFKLLATKVDPTIWNDKAATTGARKGLGARTCMELWNVGGYEQICDLIKHGVDTSLPTILTFVPAEWKKGTHSGFVSPIQHTIAPYLRDVGRLEAKDKTLQGEDKKKAAGAQKIFAALAAKLEEDEKKKKKVKSTDKTMTNWTSVTTMTSWKDLQDSDWMKAFKDKPGTIWGFENVRAPYVQAGHANTEKSRPLRMWELWDAVGVEQQGYADLLNDPEGYADKKVAEAAKLIEDKKSTRIEYGDIKNMNEFLEQFKKDAKRVLLEFAAQMPKGTFADSAKQAGFMEPKYLGGLGCKAGLWWAKEQKEPIYYCLDGINMDDVVNYKKVKSAAIDDFLSGRDKKRQNEVITMVEVREILKNWNDLKYKNEKGADEDVVKFVYKGKILSGKELADNLKKWQTDMDQVNKSMRTVAPDFKTFTAQLNKIDTKLLVQLGKVTDAKQANVDARDIVKKHGYFVKLANAKPHIALKYVMNKCDVLGEYGLISKALPPAAVALKNAIDKKDNKEIATAQKNVRTEIALCHQDYQEPLESALFPKPKPKTDTTV